MDKGLYDSVVNALMENDHNGTWDEIYEDAENDLEYATQILVSALERMIKEENLEGEELEFYKFQLAKINGLVNNKCDYCKCPKCKIWGKCDSCNYCTKGNPTIDCDNFENK